MNCYKYNQDGIYIGVGVCQLDPLESELQNTEVYLLPKNATLIEPTLELEVNEVYKFDIENDCWVKVKDVSKNIYYDKSNGDEKRFEFGDMVDENIYTLTQSNENYTYQKFENNLWIPDLEKYKDYYRQIAKRLESQKLDLGFTYNGFTFDCDSKAQIFISGLLTAVNSQTINSVVGFTTKNGTDISLTGDNIKELHLTGLAYIQNCHQWKREKYTEIQNCQSLEELQLLEELN